MPLGAARLTLLAFQPTVAAVAEVIRKKVGIIATGDVRVETDQSKFGGSSAYFPGTNGMLEISSTANPSGTGDFTLEFWVYLSDQNRFNALYDARTANPDNAIFLYYDNRGASTILNCTIAGSTIVQDTTTGIADNTWTHIAVSRSGSSVYLFIGGTLVDTGTNSTDLDVQPGYFGLTSFNSGNDYLGYMDEVRISKTARYTTGFTPSTAPFVNDANTLLLMHMDGTDASTFFEDDNGVGRSAVGVSAVGNAQVDTADYKFGGSSLELDGTGDYLLMDSTFNSNFSFTGDFTVECWANADTLGNNLLITNWAPGFWFGYFSSTSFRVYLNNTLVVNGGDPGIGTGTWAHYAVTRSGTDVKIFINGTQLGSTGTASGTIDMQDATAIGANYNNGSVNQFWDGHIDEVRFSNTARYTANFTAPTAPFVNDSNTLLLLHMDGTDGSTVFRDDNGTGRSAVPMIAKNNAQIDTAQYKFGGSSSLFDGTDDYIALGADTSADQVATIPTTGEFTIECWVRFNTNTNYRAFVSQYGYNGQANPVGRAALYLTNGNKFAFFINGGGAIAGTTSSSTGVWYHIAATRDSSNVVRLFVNGTEEGTNFTSSAAIVDSYTAIGATSNSLDFDMDGHIDEVRISNIARYTANFTAPTEPFQNDANTVFLSHMDGTDASTDFIDDNGKESA